MENKDIKGFYNSIYKSGDIRDNMRLYRWIVRLIDPGPSSSLLDVGCGIGCTFFETAKKRISGFGLDISQEALNKARQAFPDVRLCVADGEKIPFKDKSFDNAISLGSIEHFLSPENGIKEISRVLKNKGKAALILPNSFFLGDILKVLLKGKCEEAWQVQEKVLTREQWRALIEGNGLKVERIYGYNKFPEFFKEGTLKMKSIRKFIRTFLMKHLCPLNLSWQFVFVCKKENGRL